MVNGTKGLGTAAKCSNTYGEESKLKLPSRNGEGIAAEIYFRRGNRMKPEGKSTGPPKRNGTGEPSSTGGKS